MVNFTFSFELHGSNPSYQTGSPSGFQIIDLLRQMVCHRVYTFPPLQTMVSQLNPI